MQGVEMGKVDQDQHGLREGKARSLKTIYLTVLTVAFALSFVAYAAFTLQSEKRQAEMVLLEEARMFAHEMDAVWKFMDNSQSVINNSTKGGYEFKGLHCAVVGKSVGKLFSFGTDYVIRYTNFNPRNEQDVPDEFEAEALEEFNAQPGEREFYGFAPFDGEDRFRYVQALEVDESCLECHGSPQGEIDITGYAKEGWEIGDVGGAISIVIPDDQHERAFWENIMRDLLFFILITTLIGTIVYGATRVFVLRPLKGLHGAFGQMRQGRLNASLENRKAAKEVTNLIDSFNDMAGELRDMYGHLETQVQERTFDLQEANSLLERQRDKLEVLNGELAQETRFKSDLLSMVNHELRTPLTAILTFAQAARKSCGSEREDDQRAWDHIEKNSQILLGMINDMLDIARSDAGTVQVACEAIDLGEVVAVVRETMAPLADKYLVTFRATVASDVPLVLGDYDKTTRILENLVNNAIKFTPDDGAVSLSVTFDAAATAVKLVVADTGIGIAPADQDRIFDRFVQVDSTSTRKYNGSGLGLALVREYAEQQGFTVSVESALGEGSSFIVVIPESKLVRGNDE